jgi:hypothetical protein
MVLMIGQNDFLRSTVHPEANTDQTRTASKLHHTLFR